MDRRDDLVRLGGREAIDEIRGVKQASKALSRTRAPGQRCDFGSGGPADRANALLVFER
jgi:hypothetical protein